MKRYLIIYQYYEKNDLYRQNLEFFLKTGSIDDADYVFIVSGGCSTPIPSAKNIRVLYRPNVGLDFGSYEDAFRDFVDPSGYDYVCLLNCTVRGPFLLSHSSTPWIEIFTNKLSGETKLVGTTINILHTSSNFASLFKQNYRFRSSSVVAHVQSMMLVIDRQCMEFLSQIGFFRRQLAANWQDTVVHYEILLSQLILARGWNIACLMPEYDLDYRKVDNDVNPTSWEGNSIDRNAYFGRSLHPYETVFFKNNRGTREIGEMNSLSQSMLNKSDDKSSFWLSAELDIVLSEYPSAWIGHKNFAMWLVGRTNPKVVVDLGVDYGFSTFCFAGAGAEAVIGIDSFEGDEHAGKRSTYDFVIQSKTKLRLDNVSFIKGYFHEVAESWSGSIDILHIDGRHNYEDVKCDYFDWHEHVRNGGIVLLHDVCVAKFGVRAFFDELELPKLILSNSFGLGVASSDAALIAEIAEVFSSLVEPGSLNLKE